MAVPKSFFKIDCQAVKIGAFAGWSKASLLLYLTLKAHENYGTHEAYPGYNTIQRMTGLSRNCIKAAIDELMVRKVLDYYDSGADMRTVNRYRLREDWEPIDPKVFREKKRKWMQQMRG